MARATLTCKTCGKEYPACSTANWGVWRWQDVACCKEHAMEYIALVEQNRNRTRENAQENNEAAPGKKLTARIVVKPDTPENWTEQTADEPIKRTSRKTARKASGDIEDEFAAMNESNVEEAE